MKKILMTTDLKMHLLLQNRDRGGQSSGWELAGDLMVDEKGG